MICTKQLIVSYVDEKLTFSVKCFGNCHACQEAAFYQAAESAFEVYSITGIIPETIKMPNNDIYKFDLYLFDRYLSKHNFTTNALINNLQKVA